VLPPAGQVTISEIGFEGYACACAAPLHSAGAVSAIAANSLANLLMVASFCG
jgi:hypothetical protein